MRLKPQDKQRLAYGGFLLTLGLVGWGFFAGWFSGGPPEAGRESVGPRFGLFTGRPGRMPKPEPPANTVVKVRRKSDPAVPDPQVRVVEKILSAPRSAPVEEAPARPRWDLTPDTIDRGAYRSDPRSPSEPERGSPPGADRHRPQFNDSGYRTTTTPPPVRPVEWLRYGGALGGHWIDDITLQGKVVELEDGSVWEVRDTDQSMVRAWKPAQNVTIQSGGLPPYPYRLAGKYGRGADVRLIRKPTGARQLPRGGEEVEVEQ